jgi:hypothetical protein
MLLLIMKSLCTTFFIHFCKVYLNWKVELSKFTWCILFVWQKHDAYLVCTPIWMNRKTIEKDISWTVWGYWWWSECHTLHKHRSAMLMSIKLQHACVRRMNSSLFCSNIRLQAYLPVARQCALSQTACSEFVLYRWHCCFPIHVCNGFMFFY